MPHYRDGTKALLFDRVIAQTGMTYPAAGPDGVRPAAEPIFSEALVVGITEGANCCELTLLVGSGKLLGSVSLPQFKAPEDPPPRAGVILDGYWTSANAKECQFLPRPMQLTPAVAAAATGSATTGVACAICGYIDPPGTGHLHAAAAVGTAPVNTAGTALP